MEDGWANYYRIKYMDIGLRKENPGGRIAKKILELYGVFWRH